MCKYKANLRHSKAQLSPLATLAIKFIDQQKHEVNTQQNLGLTSINIESCIIMLNPTTTQCLSLVHFN